MHHLSECQFYITDRCDLACEHCITYNNWSWGSRLKIADHRADLEQWSQVLSIDTITVLGGEPLLNPELDQWLKLIQKLWPWAAGVIATNGRHLHKIDPEWLEDGWIIEVSAHDRETFEQALRWANLQWPQSQRRWLEDEGPRQEHSMEFLDLWGHRVALIRLAVNFNQWPWTLKDRELHWDQLRDSAAEHRACAVNDCRYMVGSTLYRCPQQALFPRISSWVAEPWRELTQQDLGCTVRDDLDQWFETIDHSQTQCSLCRWTEPRVHGITQGQKITLDPRIKL